VKLALGVETQVEMWYKNTYNWRSLQASKRLGIQNCSSSSIHDAVPSLYQLPSIPFLFFVFISFHSLPKDTTKFWAFGMYGAQDRCINGLLSGEI